MANEQFNYTHRWANLRLPKAFLDELGKYLEDRDRELEAYLKRLAENAVSIDAPEWTDGFTPAPHHASHEPGGSDEIPVIAGPPGIPGVDGADGVDADPMLAAILAPVTRGPKGDTGGTGATGADGDPVIAGLFAHGPRGQKGDTGLTGGTGPPGADADEGLVWMQGPDSDLEARRRLALIEELSAATEALAWVTNPDSDLEARRLIAVNTAAIAALAVTDAAGNDASDALHWAQVGP